MLERLLRFIEPISRWLNVVAGIALVLMILFTCADVVGRKLLNHPVSGTYENVGFLNVIVVAFALVYTYRIKGLVSVELITDRLPKRAQWFISAFVALLGLVFFVLLTWQSIEYGNTVWRTGEVSITQKLPFYPIIYGIAFSCIPVCLMLFLDLIESMMKALNK